MTPETQEVAKTQEVKQTPEVKQLQPDAQAPAGAPQPQQKPMSPQEQLDRLDKFHLTKEGLNELAACINEVVRGKWVQKTIFDALNEVLIPIYKEEKKDESKAGN